MNDEHIEEKLEVKVDAPRKPIVYDDRPVKQMLYPALIFLVIFMAMGVFMAFNVFVFPNTFIGEYISFGRLRPVHVNGILLLFLIPANMGLLYYIVPRLCGCPLWNYKLATVANILWWASTFLSTFSFPFGTNFGWEYDEHPMFILGFIPIKPTIGLAWVLFGVVIFGTIACRRFRKMYVSLWYTMGTIIWTAFTFVFAGILIEQVAPGGISRVNINFFYIHNLVGLTFTPMGVAIAYYFIPKAANTPLYSHRLSMIGFWSIAFFYAWVGAHHIIHGPISQWLQTMSIIFSIWLFIPVWTVVANFFLTLKGQWHKYSQDATIRFLMMGTFFYLVTCIQGPIQALRNINEVTSKTDWIIGHSHISLYGTFAFFAFGGIYYALPRVANKPLWSHTLANWHFTTNLIGSFLFLLALFVGGFLQGLQWADWANGATYAQFQYNLAKIPFLQTIVDMWPWWLMRAIGGSLILFGNLLFVINMFNTILLDPREGETQ
ncbi:cbb3-type cytochrome c oxidase subunit I [Simkania negevensis]|uniref:Cbb3-type cytochrome c oxidase subunit I n=1 Tax=Simkania negevensis TaxID=83561 RepID=A0ABS3APK1_9BACT|nr:cbb3-type cytochrome c oxidase subunit I [Simkania negevensis]